MPQYPYPAKIRLLPNAKAMSEFQGYFGDCGQTAELAALHCVKGLALDAATLNAIVGRDVARGWAASNGAEPIGAIANDLTQIEGVSCTNYGYSEPFGVDWRRITSDNAGRQPVIFEFANAGNLPGDEKGVHYHFICVLGVGPSGYLCADGDNPLCRDGTLAIYTEEQLAAATPCALLVVTYTAPVGAPRPPMPTPTNTAGLGDGILKYVQAKQATGTFLGESLIPGGEADLYYGNPTGERLAAFKDGDFAYWNGKGMVEGVAGDVVAGLWKANKAAHDQLATTQTQLQAAQAATLSAQHDAQHAQLLLQQEQAAHAADRVAAQNAEGTLQQQLDAVQAALTQLTNQHNTPPPPPPPDARTQAALALFDAVAGVAAFKS